jgi:hypothetical protein
MSRRDVATIIVCRDTVSDLRRLVGWLEAAGHENVVLLDNASTYPPLLDYLGASPHRVVRLDHNLGHEAPWTSGLVASFGPVPFIVTDPDVVPDDETPHDAAEHFQDLLRRHQSFDQAGFGLHIDDLPQEYPHRDAVMAWERPFWERELEPRVFTAHIDTTFALYRPGTGYKVTEALRTDLPYLARHLPWYRDPRKPDAETAYYFARRRPDVGYWNRPELPAAVAARMEGPGYER